MTKGQSDDILKGDYLDYLLMRVVPNFCSKTEWQLNYAFFRVVCQAVAVIIWNQSLYDIEYFDTFFSKKISAISVIFVRFGWKFLFLFKTCGNHMV